MIRAASPKAACEAACIALAPPRRPFFTFQKPQVQSSTSVLFHWWLHLERSSCLCIGQSTSTPLSLSCPNSGYEISGGSTFGRSDCLTVRTLGAVGKFFSFFSFFAFWSLFPYRGEKPNLVNASAFGNFVMYRMY